MEKNELCNYHRLCEQWQILEWKKIRRYVKNIVPIAIVAPTTTLISTSKMFNDVQYCRHLVLSVCRLSQFNTNSCIKEFFMMHFFSNYRFDFTHNWKSSIFSFILRFLNSINVAFSLFFAIVLNKVLNRKTTLNALISHLSIALDECSMW